MNFSEKRMIKDTNIEFTENEINIIDAYRNGYITFEDVSVLVEDSGSNQKSTAIWMKAYKESTQKYKESVKKIKADIKTKDKDYVLKETYTLSYKEMLKEIDEAIGDLTDIRTKVQEAPEDLSTDAINIILRTLDSTVFNASLTAIESIVINKVNDVVKMQDNNMLKNYADMLLPKRDKKEITSQVLQASKKGAKSGAIMSTAGTALSHNQNITINKIKIKAIHNINKEILKLSKIRNKVKGLNTASKLISNAETRAGGLKHYKREIK